MNADQATLRLKRILRSFMSAQEEDADCNECFDHLDQFVEMVEAGQDASTVLPRIEKHLTMCKDCDEEYQMLLSMLRAQVGPDKES
jgi:hypothetical protein